MVHCITNLLPPTVVICRGTPKSFESHQNVAVSWCCSVILCVTVCCSVLQCVAVWRSVLQLLQCVAVCCSVLQCVSQRLSSVQAPPSLLSLTKVLQCHGVAVCCSVLQCCAVCCSALQCVAVCCSVLQYVSEQWLFSELPSSLMSHTGNAQGVSLSRRCSVLQCVAMFCSVLQCVAMCCSLLQSVAVCCSVFTLALCGFCQEIQQASVKAHSCFLSFMTNTLHHAATHCNTL